MRVDTPREERANRMAERRDEDPTHERSEDLASIPRPAEERIAKLEEDLRRKAEEAAANQERYVRAVADGENFKKRLQREKSEGIRFANETLLRELLQVIDNLELALEHADAAGNGKAVAEGLQLTLRLFREVLERNGVKEISDPTGTAFDPSTQEAAELEADDGVAPNTVIRARTKGYRYNGRLLRPARVVVATGSGAGGAPESAR